MSEETARELPGSGHLPRASGLDPPTLQSRLWVSVFYIVVIPLTGHFLSDGLGGASFWVPAGVGATVGAVASVVRPLAPPKRRRVSEASSWAVLAGGTGLAVAANRLFPGDGLTWVVCLVGLTVACYVAGSSIHHLVKRRTGQRERPE